MGLLRYFQRALVAIVFAPFAAIASLIGMILIGIGFAIMFVESLVGIDEGFGDMVYNFGVKTLPSFFYERR